MSEQLWLKSSRLKIGQSTKFSFGIQACASGVGEMSKRVGKCLMFSMGVWGRGDISRFEAYQQVQVSCDAHCALNQDSASTANTLSIDAYG